MKKNEPKILIFDIETFPLVVLSWEARQRGYWNAIKILEDWKMLSFSYKWFGEKVTHVRALPDYPLYKKDPKDDKSLVTELWKLFNEADIIIGHNGDQFDIKKSNARFIKHKLTPPPPIKTIDTLKVARKHFKFDSNKLNDLGEYLGVGKKERTGGIDLWLDCMAGDMSAWKKMKTYNKQDVILLERVYKSLRPWIKNHPNNNLYTGRTHNCPSCGSNNTQRRGFSMTRVGKYQRYACQSCGSWSTGEVIRREKGNKVILK